MMARSAGLLLWLLVGGVAAVAAYWQLAHPPRPPAAVGANRILELPAVEPTRPFQLPPLDRYGEIVLHPLFISTRQPEPPPPPDEAPPERPPAPPKTEQKLTLLGVMITSSAKKALLRPEEPNAKTVRIGLGEKVGEWLLEAIFPDRVVLRKGQSTQELPLVRPQKSLGPHAQRAGARRGRDVQPVSQPVVTPKPDALPPSVVPTPPQPDG